jgi:hypothetical protein
MPYMLKGKVCQRLFVTPVTVGGGDYMDRRLGHPRMRPGRPPAPAKAEPAPGEAVVRLAGDSEMPTRNLAFAAVTLASQRRSLASSYRDRHSLSTGIQVSSSSACRGFAALMQARVPSPQTQPLS